MSELGGPTTQSGILYQNSITALFLGRLCDVSERIDSEKVVHVRAEAPDNIDDTVITFADGHREYIQAKENIASNGEVWSKMWEHFDLQFNAEKFAIGKDKIKLQIGFPHKDHRNLSELCERAFTSLTT